MNARTITATYHITTPLFMGGAGPSASAHVRASSFKGALRFWWRALEWASVAEGRSESDALAELRAREASLFGTAGLGDDDESGAHQSPFLLAVFDRGAAPAMKSMSNCSWGTAYALGQGLYDVKRSAATREALVFAPDSTFEVCMLVRPGKVDQVVDGLLPALEIIGLLGGLGARSRRAFGSLSLRSIIAGDRTVEGPATRDVYVASLRRLIPAAKLPSTEPAFSAISRLTSGGRCAVGRPNLVATPTQRTYTGCEDFHIGRLIPQAGGLRRLAR